MPTESNCTHSIPTGPRRVRAQRGKSRRGCHQCKTRHIRCDESNAQCDNCLRYGIQCSGYDQKLRWSDKHERFRAAPTPSTSTAKRKAISKHSSAVDDNANVVARAPEPNVLLSPIDLSTALIEYWFEHVCPMWSTFDSDVNYNRQIATIHCTNSEVVFYTLQTMSAALLSEHTPRLRHNFRSLASEAKAAVERRTACLQASYDGDAHLVTTDLVFSVLALGTSAHWAGSFQCGHSSLTSARKLLALWTTGRGRCEPEVLAYFQQALVYWDTLLSAVDCNCNYELSRSTALERQEAAAGRTQNPVSNVSGAQVHMESFTFSGTRPNSWCGISSDVVGMLGEVFALSRRARKRKGERTFATPKIVLDRGRDMDLAHQIHSRLLGMDFENTLETDERLGYSLQTGDSNTPLAHHLRLAESYRLAALLHLHLACHEMSVMLCQITLATSETLASGFAGISTTDAESCADPLSALALRLVTILEDVPAHSGSRRMQLLLYVSAAAGLRYERCVGFTTPERAGTGGMFGFRSTGSAGEITGTREERTSGPTHVGPEDVSRAKATRNIYRGLQTSESVSELVDAELRISKARSLVLKRLRTLLGMLPSRPVEVAIELVKEIWKAYDSDEAERAVPNWLDIMTRNGLRTLFM